MVLFAHLTMSKFPGRKPSSCQYNVPFILISVMKTLSFRSSVKCLAAGWTTEVRFSAGTMIFTRHLVSYPVGVRVVGWTAGVQFPAGARISFYAITSRPTLGPPVFLHNGWYLELRVLDDRGSILVTFLSSPLYSQPASYPVAPGVPFPGGKLVGAWSWLVLSSRMRGTYAWNLCHLRAFTVWYLNKATTASCLYLSNKLFGQCITVAVSVCWPSNHGFRRNPSLIQPTSLPCGLRAARKSQGALRVLWNHVSLIDFPYRQRTVSADKLNKQLRANGSPVRGTDATLTICFYLQRCALNCDRAIGKGGWDM
jgi:hypothetical protein